MSDELEFAALHADDVLLDALGARHDLPGGFGSDDDAVAGLLRAFADEIDARPGPLADLLAPAAVPALRGSGEFAPAPPAVVPLAPRRRRRGLLASRAAAFATVGAVVLGAGGVSAAVTGEGSPLENIRNVMSTVTEQVTPQRSDADRVSRLLDGAENALAGGDMRTAQDLLAQAASLLSGVDEGRELQALRAEMTALQARFERMAAPGAAATTPVGRAGSEAAEESAPRSAGTDPATEPSAAESAAATEDPEGLTDRLLPGRVPTDRLPGVPAEPGLGEAKERLERKAEEKLDPLPGELPRPVDELRTPAGDAIGGLIGPTGRLHELTGDALTRPDVRDVADDLANGAAGAAATPPAAR